MRNSINFILIFILFTLVTLNNACSDVFKRRVRRWSFPRAAIAIPARGILIPACEVRKHNVPSLPTQRAKFTNLTC